MNATALTTRRLTLTNSTGGISRRGSGVARPPISRAKPFSLLDENGVHVVLTRPPIMAKVAQTMNDNAARAARGSK